MKIFQIIIYLLAALMVVIICITIYKNLVARKRRKHQEANSEYIRANEKKLRAKGFKKFTFRVAIDENKKVPRHIWAPDFKTANAMHQEDLRNGNI